MDFDWKKHAEQLRMVIVSGAHRLAKELPPGLVEILAIYKRVAGDGGLVGGGPALMQEMQAVFAAYPDEPTLLWEPLKIGGWNIRATLYRRDSQLWWLLHAQRSSEQAPSEQAVRFLDKILEHLGAVPTLHQIIGPLSSPAGEPWLPFGWWTWRNHHPLFDIQINQDKRDQDRIRLVPLGSRETDGYRSLGADLPEQGDE